MKNNTYGAVWRAKKTVRVLHERVRLNGTAANTHRNREFNRTLKLDAAVTLRVFKSSNDKK